MVWTNEKDEVLCREVLLYEPYQFKPRSRERGNAWKSIADTLCSSELNFKVDARAVRERLSAIVAKHKQKMISEQSASGISPAHSPLDDALEEISNKIDEAEQNYDKLAQENNGKIQENARKAMDMRNRAIESLGETQARRNDENEPGASPNSTPLNKRRRSSGTETIAYLRDKAEADQHLKQQELDLRKQEIELRKQELQQQSQQQNVLFETLQKQSNNMLLFLMNQHQTNSK